MRSNQRHSNPLWGAPAALAVVLWAATSAAWGQGASDSEPEGAGQPAKLTLTERQRVVRDRVQRLESRILKLSHLLEESDPAKAERLRDALKFTGSHRVKARVEQLAELLKSGQLSEADRQQELLLADLDALLTLLTSSLNEVERRRAERQRLENLKRAIRALLDEQTEVLYRTQHAEQRARALESQQADAAASREVTEALRRLEQRQRDAQRRAGELQRDMQKSDDHARPTAGVPQIGHAADQMQQAADALAEKQPADAQQRQHSALEQLQQALDEIDDALRQVRREEAEETLAALEARFRSMLTRERQILEVVEELSGKGVDGWTRVDRLRLAESAEVQRSVTEGCQATLRILVDEGTTVIVPELIRQVAADMVEVSARLDRSDTSVETQRVLTGILAVLEEVLGAIEQKREQDARLEQPTPQAEGGPRPLLPGSAELKLLRSSQVRLNERTVELAGSGVRLEDEQTGELERLSQRQRRLAELARRMNERK